MCVLWKWTIERYGHFNRFVKCANHYFSSHFEWHMVQSRLLQLNDAMGCHSWVFPLLYTFHSTSREIRELCCVKCSIQSNLMVAIQFPLQSNEISNRNQRKVNSLRELDCDRWIISLFNGISIRKRHWQNLQFFLTRAGNEKSYEKIRKVSVYIFWKNYGFSRSCFFFADDFYPSGTRRFFSGWSIFLLSRIFLPPILQKTSA